ncbi:MAG TPA: aldose epimerase family protein [Tepidisphaeraceae bacterium]|nr:aldose epimerase family protein [Tepidisphaeraceae bacterium]
MIHRTLSLLALLTLCLCAAAPADVTAPTAPAAPIQTRPFGNAPDGSPITQYILTNNKGSYACIINYGAIVTNLFVPDKTGKLGDVVLGFDSVADYANAGPFMGCIAGRYANRIANGMFTLDGETYALPLNAGMNTLHGGFKGYAKRVWDADAGVTPDGPTLRLSLLDPDGEEGFPGNVKVTVYYTMTNDNALKVQYFATTDKATPINLTHHSYFNLRADGNTDVLAYVCKIDADHYIPADASLIPTGQIAPVAGTPFDFTKAKFIGQDIKQCPGTPPGYDHTMVLDKQPGEFSKAVDVYDPVSGRLLECWTTEPGVHFYTAAGLGAVKGKYGITYGPYRAFCLETQHFPDSPNHPNFPNTILRPDEVYRQITEFKFSIPTTPLMPGE